MHIQKFKSRNGIKLQEFKYNFLNFETVHFEDETQNTNLKKAYKKSLCIKRRIKAFFFLGKISCKHDIN